MRPMHQAAEIVPFEHAPDAHTITHPDRHAFRKVDIVCDQQCHAVAYVDDKALMTRTVIVIR